MAFEYDESKYELIPDPSGLFRIRALIDIPKRSVKVGTIGGLVAGRHNLDDSIMSDCWISEGAAVYNGARVSGDAVVCGDARVFDKAIVSDNAIVADDAQVFGTAKVGEKAYVDRCAKVYDDATVEGEAYVSDKAEVYGQAFLTERAIVRGFSRVHGNAFISDKAKIENNSNIFGKAYIANSFICEYAEVSGNADIDFGAHIRGSAKIGGTANIHGPILVNGNTVVNSNRDILIFNMFLRTGSYITWTRSNNMWHAGSFNGTSEQLLELAAKRGSEIKQEYLRIINYVKDVLEYENMCNKD